MPTSSHASQIPPAVAAYMRAVLDPDAAVRIRRLHPVVRSTFVPGRGWRRYPIRKAVSASWARKAKADGVTEVQLAFAGHYADFRIGELQRRKT